VVDLHCHYPMHLLAKAPRDVVRGMARVRGRPRWLERLRAFVLLLAARVLNFRAWGGGWRVSLDGLERGGVEVALSVLYDPFAELDLDERYAAPPEHGYFASLEAQLDRVEADLHEIDADGARHVVVRTAADLDAALSTGRVGFVHCVEGGFHLGAEPDEVAANIAALAARGVRYVTLAHLFYRRVATNAPAIPFLPDRDRRTCQQAHETEGEHSQHPHPGEPPRRVISRGITSTATSVSTTLATTGDISQDSSRVQSY